MSRLLSFNSDEPSTLSIQANVNDLVKNPITEVAVLPLSDDLSNAEIQKAMEDSKNFGCELMTSPAPVAFGPGSMALSYQTSWIVELPKNRLLMLIGWREVDNHIEAAKTLTFQDNLKPIVDRMTGQLEVTHFKFQKV